MLDSEEWKARVVHDLSTTCPICLSTNVTMGACAMGSATVYQEYTCESCQYEFTAMFALVGFYRGHPEL